MSTWEQQYRANVLNKEENRVNIQMQLFRDTFNLDDKNLVDKYLCNIMTEDNSQHYIYDSNRYFSYNYRTNTWKEI